MTTNNLKVGIGVSIIPPNKNNLLSSRIYDILTESDGNTFYLICTRVGSYIDIQEMTFEDFEVNNLVPSLTPQEMLYGNHSKNDIHVECIYTGRSKDEVLLLAASNQNQRHRLLEAIPNEDDEYDIVDGLISIGDPVCVEGRDEVFLVQQFSASRDRCLIVSKDGRNNMASVSKLTKFNTNISKDNLFKKEDLLEVLDQNKSAEEILLDLRDHLTN